MAAYRQGRTLDKDSKPSIHLGEIMDLTGSQNAAIAVQISTVFQDFDLNRRFPALYKALSRVITDPASCFDIYKAGGARQVIPKYATDELADILLFAYQAHRDREMVSTDQWSVNRQILNASSLFSVPQTAAILGSVASRVKYSSFRIAGLPFNRLGGNFNPDSLIYILNAVRHKQKPQQMRSPHLCVPCLVKAKDLGTGVAVLARLTGEKVNHINYLLTSYKGTGCDHDRFGVGREAHTNNGGNIQSSEGSGSPIQYPRNQYGNGIKPPLTREEIRERYPEQFDPPPILRQSHSVSGRVVQVEDSYGSGSPDVHRAEPNPSRWGTPSIQQPYRSP